MVGSHMSRGVARELERWVAEGLLAPEQADRIRARYKPPSGTRFVGVLFAFGAVLIGLGIILAISANWQGLSSGVKLALVVAFVAAFNALGFHYRHGRGGRRRLGDALLLMGGFAYGAGIWLVAQAFHFPLGAPVAMCAWALGVLLAAWVLASRPLLVLAGVLAPAWLVSLERGIFGSEPAALWVLGAWVPVSWAVVHMARRRRSAPALVFVLLGWAFWVGSVSEKMGAEGVAYPVALALFGLFLVLARGRLGATGGQAEAVAATGLLVLFFAGLPMTFRDAFTDWYYPNELYPPTLLALLVGVGYLAWKVASDPSRRAEGRAYLAAGVALGLLPMLSADLSSALFPMANVVLFGTLLAVAYSAHQRRAWGLFLLALWLLGIYLVVRYFAVFSNILPQALFFVVGGILLVGGGLYMERSARRLFAAGAGE